MMMSRETTLLMGKMHRLKPSLQTLFLARRIITNGRGKNFGIT
jgi:hypothetical protein